MPGIAPDERSALAHLVEDHQKQSALLTEIRLAAEHLKLQLWVTNQECATIQAQLLQGQTARDKAHQDKDRPAAIEKNLCHWKEVVSLGCEKTVDNQTPSEVAAPKPTAMKKKKKPTIREDQKPHPVEGKAAVGEAVVPEPAATKQKQKRKRRFRRRTKAHLADSHHDGPINAKDQFTMSSPIPTRERDGLEQTTGGASAINKDNVLSDKLSGEEAPTVAFADGTTLSGAPAIENHAPLSDTFSAKLDLNDSGWLSSCSTDMSEMATALAKLPATPTGSLGSFTWSRPNFQLRRVRPVGGGGQFLLHLCLSSDLLPS